MTSYLQKSATPVDIIRETLPQQIIHITTLEVSESFVRYVVWTKVARIVMIFSPLVV